MPIYAYPEDSIALSQLLMEDLHDAFGKFDSGYQQLCMHCTRPGKMWLMIAALPEKLDYPNVDEKMWRRLPRTNASRSST